MKKEEFERYRHYFLLKYWRCSFINSTYLGLQANEYKRLKRDTGKHLARQRKARHSNTIGSFPRKKVWPTEMRFEVIRVCRKARDDREAMLWVRDLLMKDGWLDQRLKKKFIGFFDDQIFMKRKLTVSQDTLWFRRFKSEQKSKFIQTLFPSVVLSKQVRANISERIEELIDREGLPTVEWISRVTIVDKIQALIVRWVEKQENFAIMPCPHSQFKPRIHGPRFLVPKKQTPGR